MNDLLLAEPSSCQDASEFRMLLEKFGPETGRYLVAFPSDWKKLVFEHFAGAGMTDQERVKTLVRRAQEEMKVVKSGHPFEAELDWTANALPALASPRFAAGVFSRPGPTPSHAKAFTMDTLRLAPTAEDRVPATADGIERACRVVLETATELWFVDPFLDPSRGDRYPVVEKMLRSVSSRCRQVSFWARYTQVSGRPGDEGRLQAALDDLRKHSGLGAGCSLKLILVDDARAKRDLHARFLFSERAGVRLDQGFQQLTAGHEVDVAPTSQVVLHHLHEVHREGKHDMLVAAEFKT